MIFPKTRYYQNVITMRTSLRNATTDDADRIADMYLTSRERYLSYAPVTHTDKAVRTWIRETLIPSGNVTVALIENSIVGFLAISRDSDYGWIDHLYLDPTKTNIGLGSFLTNEAKRLLGGPIRLYTFQANADARRFYHRHGFREIELSDGALNEEKTPDVLMEWP